ncbi:MAG: tetratricopeptide repeat protein [Patescibacteria group bacterium]
MDWEKLNHITEEKLPEIKTLFIVLISLIGFFAIIDAFLSQFINLTIRGIFYLLLLLAWIIFWLCNKFVLPRNKKNKVGIVISIYSENEIERRKLKIDFISKLKKDFQKEGILNFSEIIFLKNHFSKIIKDSDDPLKVLEKINKKIKAHFYVWGDIKKRPDGDEGEKYFLSFQGYVIHRPISKSLSQDISRDFSKVLPREVNFLEKRSFKGFEASAELVHLAAKYIIGIAAFVSQDPILALKLHDGLKEQFNIHKPLPSFLQDIVKRIPILISDETLWVARWHHANQRISETKSFLSRSLIENNENYGTWLFKAIIDFSIDSNIVEALKSVDKAEKYSSNSFEWMYSKAFLSFWTGNYDQALKLCQKIKKLNYPNEETTTEEVRAFNLQILNNDKSKPQLYFWIGYLSYFKEKNLCNALQDFEEFEKQAGKGMDNLKQKSSAYLIEIRQKMKITK